MTVTHYKLISTKAYWMGIDFFDAVFIICAFAVVYIFTSALLLDVIFCCCLYVGARVLKATKPDRWLVDVLRYYFKSPYYHATNPREVDHGSR